jgi:(1->4)-alpha-D-glucan 1-alpha-D-glucosylmutase
VENENVFTDMHALLLKWVKQGWISGLRVDHVDGLYDPQNYLLRLQRACDEARGLSFHEPGPHFYIIVEKILLGLERLRPQWFVFGTTGYDYLNLVNGVFVVPESRLKMQEIYEHFIDQKDEMKHVIYVCKKLILIVSMASELHLLARHLEEISEQHRWSRDFTLESLRAALREIIACFPVYRSYIRAEDAEVQDEDRAYILAAIAYAKRLNPASDPSIFDFIESVLLLQDPPGLSEDQIFYRRHFVMRFQQLTGPVMAKGAEDTAFYRFYPLASLNEVGMDHASFGTPLSVFHRKNLERLENWPHTLAATFTHDTKRSEDVRARLNALSETPKAWEEALQRWQHFNQIHKIILPDNREFPDRNEEFLLYQTLIGSWPLFPMDDLGRMQYQERIENYMIKAAREAKIHTSWINPNEVYEKGIQQFIQRVLHSKSNHQFLEDFERFLKPLSMAGIFNSLSQTTLKMTTPGIPDFYQGSELWEFTLVDPDNRRPVDYSHREHLLTMLKRRSQENLDELIGHLMENLEDGAIKLYIIWRILNFRAHYPFLFREGDYLPLEVIGAKARHVAAFSRIKGNHQIIVAVGRFYSQLPGFPTKMPIGKVWDDTAILLPSQLEGNFREVLSGQTIKLNQNKELNLEQIFAKFPFAVLEKGD